jgi:hypothetical protein
MRTTSELYGALLGLAAYGEAGLHYGLLEGRQRCASKTVATAYLVFASLLKPFIRGSRFHRLCQMTTSLA